MIRFHAPLRRFLLSAIRAYQRYLSPRKGFCCAYRFHTGRQGCSALGYRAVRRYGALAGLIVLRRRLHLCGVAHRRYSVVSRGPSFRTQQGFCDCSCDLPGVDACSAAGDILSCCDCGSCDWPDWKRKDKDREQYVHIPPNSDSKRGNPG